jgi:hypothetical protein
VPEPRIQDELREKLKKVAVASFFPEFKGDNSLENAERFFAEKVDSTRTTVKYSKRTKQRVGVASANVTEEVDKVLEYAHATLFK